MRSLRRLSDEELLARLPEGERRSLARHRQQLERSAQGSRPYICWSPGTMPEIVEAYRRMPELMTPVVTRPLLKSLKESLKSR